jgi:uncharacterized membrane protein HdeD (DUF308 family)
MAGVMSHMKVHDQYQESGGRLLEIPVGLICGFISAVFFGLAFMLLPSATFSSGTLVGGILLLCPGIWFANIAYRLIFNRPNTQGGLLSAGSIRFWCGAFITFGVVAIPFFLYLGEYALAISFLLTGGACFSGLRLSALRRKKSET